MLCNKCKAKEATTHVKSVVNGEYEEYMLCSECAKELGYTNMFSDIGSDFGSIFGSFFSNALPERSETTRCPQCKSTFHDISQNSKVGCAKCYETFYYELMPSIKRIHSNTTHCGKKPRAIAQIEDKTHSSENKIEELKKQLKNAVEEQKFELAAELRDKIKEMEESK